MPFDLKTSLRHYKPAKMSTQLRRRTDANLPFIDSNTRPSRILPDTNVYIDTLQGKTPADVDDLLSTAVIIHSSVAMSELTYTFGRLDPSNPGTKHVLQMYSATIADMRPDRVLAPDEELWGDAGIVVGTMTRLFSLPAGDRRKLLNDCLIALTARKNGLTVLTRNVKDFDFLGQLIPQTKVLFYRQL